MCDAILKSGIRNGLSCNRANCCYHLCIFNYLNIQELKPVFQSVDFKDNKNLISIFEFYKNIKYDKIVDIRVCKDINFFIERIRNAYNLKKYAYIIPMFLLFDLEFFIKFRENNLDFNRTTCEKLEYFCDINNIINIDNHNIILDFMTKTFEFGKKYLTKKNNKKNRHALFRNMIFACSMFSNRFENTMKQRYSPDNGTGYLQAKVEFEKLIYKNTTTQ